VTQADLDAGSITNTATATAQDPNEDPVTSESDDATVTATQSPALTLAKTADPTTVAAVGDAVSYTFTVTNTGNVTVTGVGIDEQDFSGSGTLSAIDCPTDPLAPGDSVECTASYAVTQADLDAGSITNTATATAQDPNDGAVTSESSSATVDAGQSAGISLTKKADPTIVHAAGDRVDYTFTVTNTGNVTLLDVSITEKGFSGDGTMSVVACPATTLAPQATTVCTATYRVTASDLSSAAITNTALASGVAGTTQTRVTSSASTARVIVEVPATPPPPSGGGNDAGGGAGGVSTTGSPLGALTVLAMSLLVAGVGVLSVGRRRRHG